MKYPEITFFSKLQRAFMVCFHFASFVGPPLLYQGSLLRLLANCKLTCTLGLDAAPSINGDLSIC